MKNSIFVKIFLNFFFIIFLLAALVFAFSFNTIKKHYIGTLISDLKHLAITLSPDVLPFIEKGDFNKLDRFVKSLGKKIDTRITIIAADGTVLADSKKNPSLMENHRNRPEIIETNKKGFGSSIRFSTTMKKEMLYVVIPLKNQNKTVAYVRVSLYLRDINKLLGNLKQRLFVIVLIISFFALIFAFLVSRNLSKPIIELAKETRKVSMGNFNVNVDLERKDEIGLLAKSFVEMTKKLKELFDNIKFKQEELSNIISSLSESLLVLDNKGKILLVNKSFEFIFGENQVGKNIYEVLRNHSFLKLIEEARGAGSVYGEIEIKGKFFFCSISFVKKKMEFVVILRDITEFKKLEKIKKDFVINASHELRTPLTAIKGYIETLEEEVSEDGKLFLEVVKNNTERLINIINDLLILAEIEEKGIIEDLFEVDLKILLQNVLFLFKQKAEKKGLKLLFNPDGNEKALIYGDAFKLEQLFVNLVDNAVKYTDKGEIKISLEKQVNGFLVKVADTGIGIPPSSIERIFERFYVVDKSRSKKMGGTGLGLSIVKHIVLLHNGTINVKSSKKNGTVFEVFLPFNTEN